MQPYSGDEDTGVQFVPMPDTEPDTEPSPEPFTPYYSPTPTPPPPFTEESEHNSAGHNVLRKDEVYEWTPQELKEKQKAMQQEMSRLRSASMRAMRADLGFDMSAGDLSVIESDMETALDSTVETDVMPIVKGNRVSKDSRRMRSKLHSVQTAVNNISEALEKHFRHGVAPELHKSIEQIRENLNDVQDELEDAETHLDRTDKHVRSLSRSLRKLELKNVRERTPLTGSTLREHQRTNDNRKGRNRENGYYARSLSPRPATEEVEGEMYQGPYSSVSQQLAAPGQHQLAISDTGLKYLFGSVAIIVAAYLIGKILDGRATHTPLPRRRR